MRCRLVSNIKHLLSSNFQPPLCAQYNIDVLETTPLIFQLVSKGLNQQKPLHPDNTLYLWRSVSKFILVPHDCSRSPSVIKLKNNNVM